ncbi:lamin tail domain-containing protein [bacterium]|nr:lamin tail domain-containing protein [bacterium]
MKSTLVYFMIMIAVIALPFTGHAALYINEFMADNDATIADPQGDYDDWIEIYNSGDIAINLGGLYLTDDLSSPDQWTFPDTILEAGGFLLIWADDDEGDEGLHTNFKLGASGEQIGLYDIDRATPIDTLTFGEQTVDVSYGRENDGASVWIFFDNPTPGSSNGTSSADEIGEAGQLSGFKLESNYPNPFNSATTIRFTMPTNAHATMEVLDVLGRHVATLVNGNVNAGAHDVVFNCTECASGVYFVKMQVSDLTMLRKIVLVK